MAEEKHSSQRSRQDSVGEHTEGVDVKAAIAAFEQHLSAQTANSDRKVAAAVEKNPHTAPALDTLANLVEKTSSAGDDATPNQVEQALHHAPAQGNATKREAEPEASPAMSNAVSNAATHWQSMAKKRSQENQLRASSASKLAAHVRGHQTRKKRRHMGDKGLAAIRENERLASADRNAETNLDTTDLAFISPGGHAVEQAGAWQADNFTTTQVDPTTGQETVVPRVDEPGNFTGLEMDKIPGSHVGFDHVGGALTGLGGALKVGRGIGQIRRGGAIAGSPEATAADKALGADYQRDGKDNVVSGGLTTAGGVLTAIGGPVVGGPTAVTAGVITTGVELGGSRRAGQQKAAMQGVEVPDDLPTGRQIGATTHNEALNAFKSRSVERARKLQIRKGVKATGAGLATAGVATAYTGAVLKVAGLAATAATLGVVGAAIGAAGLAIALGLGAYKLGRYLKRRHNQKQRRQERKQMIGRFLLAYEYGSPQEQQKVLEMAKALGLKKEQLFNNHGQRLKGADDLIEYKLKTW